MALPQRKSFALSRSNRKLLGVCSGLSEYFDVDVMLVRIVFVLATLLGVGAPVLIYLAAALIAD
ncbi:PspC domain-containing protein [Novosphingobium rosa]|uniref:PspC domain-containing protein n=1 Tax=Novosphingobium rosa TaxID=76978 RepID=UPI00083314D6|nr:PspC domain-containing protein [Novosphingobium rosa]